MKDLLDQLLDYALSIQASDIHFLLESNHVSIQFRTMNGLHPIQQDIWNAAFFQYLKYISGFDLTNPNVPQSGQFAWKNIFCRFSVIHNQSIQTGVLRLLSAKLDLRIDELCDDSQAQMCMNRLIHLNQGLVLTCGPTNSGKTTTIHAILHAMAKQSKYKIVSLEDPIEIEDDSYLQLQINEEQGFTYEKGITELMRHDPDVIFIGETRNAFCAQSLVNAALSGHVVVSTIHAGSCLEAIERLLDFHVAKSDLKSTLVCILSQRLYQGSHGKKVCVYEIVQKEEIEYLLENFDYPKTTRTLYDKILEGIKQGSIQDSQAEFDIQNHKR